MQGLSPDHDHKHCIRRVMSDIEARQTTEKLRLTETRARVLQYLLASHHALGAYELLDRLRDDGQAAQPPVAYRALDYLISKGLVHKIEGLNAFVACLHPSHEHSPAFVVCRACKLVSETHTDAVSSALRDTAKANGFQVEHVTVEAIGLCQACAEAVG